MPYVMLPYDVIINKWLYDESVNDGRKDDEGKK
jgi:hypothetical protein